MDTTACSERSAPAQGLGIRGAATNWEGCPLHGAADGLGLPYRHGVISAAVCKSSVSFGWGATWLAASRSDGELCSRHPLSVPVAQWRRRSLFHPYAAHIQLPSGHANALSTVGRGNVAHNRGPACLRAAVEMATPCAPPARGLNGGFVARTLWWL